MIFLTIGTQLPFDRLVRAVDEWRADRPDAEVFGQIADPGETGYRPLNFEWRAMLSPQDFDEMLDRASLIVAHAGMGSIISALMRGAPAIIMPRRAEFKEHRNDHQIATAKRLGERPGVNVAWDEAELPKLLDKLTLETETKEPIGPFAAPSLIEAIRTEIMRP